MFKNRDPDPSLSQNWIRSLTLCDHKGAIWSVNDVTSPWECWIYFQFQFSSNPCIGASRVTDPGGVDPDPDPTFEKIRTQPSKFDVIKITLNIEIKWHVWCEKGFESWCSDWLRPFFSKSGSGSDLFENRLRIRRKHPVLTGSGSTTLGTKTETTHEWLSARENVKV